MTIILICLCVFMLIAMIALVIYFRSQIARAAEMSERNFRLMASESADAGARNLTRANAEQLSALLSPLRMRLEDFNRALEKSHTDASAARRSLADQIERLERLNLTIGEEARNLSTALRGNNRVQGRWGETFLETLLEQAGLKKGVNFETQVTRDADGRAIRDDDGRHLRPDMVIRLPGDRCVVVDAKTSLSAYLDFCETSGDEAAEAAARHVASVRRHIDGLASRNYSANVESAVDQVLMFIPNDAALILALDTDRDLAAYALARHITLVSPSQIAGMVQLVAQMWRKDNQDRNAAEIARLGGLLYDSLAGFVADMQNVERNISLAAKACDAALSRLSSGPRSVLARAERLRSLGARASRRMPLRGAGSERLFSEEDGELGTEDRN